MSCFHCIYLQCIAGQVEIFESKCFSYLQPFLSWTLLTSRTDNFLCYGLLYDRSSFDLVLRLVANHQRSSYLINKGSICFILTLGLLICTLISENQDLEKSRSASNLRKISGPAHLDFFQFVTWIFFRFSFFSRCRPRKKSRFAGPEIFLRFEADLHFSRP